MALWEIRNVAVRGVTSYDNAKTILAKYDIEL